MTTLGEFASFCGPQALAALGDIAPTEAAAVLRALFPGVGRTVSAEQLLTALAGLGFDAVESIRPEDGGRVRVAGLATSRGRWLVTVTSAGLGHALAIEDGRIVAGDPFGRFGWAPVRRAWHITPKTPEDPPVKEVNVDHRILDEDDPQPAIRRVNRHRGLIGRVKLLGKRDVQDLPDFLQREVQRQLNARRTTP